MSLEVSDIDIILRERVSCNMLLSQSFRSLVSQYYPLGSMTIAQPSTTLIKVRVTFDPRTVLISGNFQLAGSIRCPSIHA